MLLSSSSSSSSRPAAAALLLLLLHLLAPPAASMHPHVPAAATEAALRSFSRDVVSEVSEVSEVAPSGLDLCCVAGDTSCLNDPNHCSVGCVDGTLGGDSCKNCQCFAASSGCCKAGYFCGGTVGVMDGACKPYCEVDPATGAICFGHGECSDTPGKCACEHGYDAATSCKTCAAGFFGAHCDPCPGGGDAASAAAPFCSGHGTCDGSGTNAGTGVCTCAKGWGTDDCSVCAKGMGPPGKCDTPVCTESCVNGKCTAPDTCACAQGWKGSTCDAPICFPQSGNGGTGTGGCGANGKCVAPDTCSCASGWSGKDCSTPVCDEVKCSAAHGTCSAPNACTCAKGWQGATCDQAICETACGAHGKCTAPDACTCAKGWRGDQCDEAVCTQ